LGPPGLNFPGADRRWRIMLLRVATPSLICDLVRRLRGSIGGSGANVIREVDAKLFVFGVAGRDNVEWVDGANMDSFE
jgi:hypothetical protein